jgi:hypothetical protein
VICDEWDARLAAELEPLRRFGPEQETEGAIRRKSSWMTKNIHQKRVGTSGGIQLSALSIMTGKAAPRGGVRLAKPATPFRPPADALVRNRVKISMGSVRSLAEYDGGQISDRAFVSQAIGRSPGESAQTEFLTQPSRVAGHWATTSTALNWELASTSAA